MVTTTEAPGLWRDAERCYRVVTARDPRFDGQFIMAVRTTGIYCRPSCPASTPKVQNVRFYPTSAAAQANGFRACRRCLPDAVPGSPDWNLRADLAARAMRLISDGTVEREGVPGLARRLGYSERQLGRVLTAELGAGPLALARAHRAHSARLLIEMSGLPLTDVAFAAGFSSVRQFNETIREVFATTPSQLRAASLRRGRRDADQGATRLSLRLPFRPPFDADGLLRFFADRAVPGVESVTDESYARTLRLAHGTGVVRLTPAPDHVRCELHLADLRDLSSAVSRVRRLLDLDADPAAVTRVLGADPALAPVVTAVPGIRVPGSVDGEELLLRALLGRDVLDVLGEQVPAEEGVTRLFPTAAQIATAGLPGDVTGVATALAEGRLDVHVGRDAAELRAELLACPGITPWTADYVLMRVLGAPDVLLTGDAALGRGAAALGIKDVADRARRWTPWCSYAGMYLWRADPAPEVGTSQP
ncbi:AlkA N-terminal domain-containing protein [Amycolatopsis sp., V23-08]|uniref:AlkA N-terminal domain-containing protein n=1 Tax=Amycolatopsis heterodermiae TaxID=3110235 RepID=A0ABU5QY00_9PSEU|nr:AlkA N-terminal domain-containing protein [Amycolatopsis sp., V23-08]MEA5358520.1 AlkA N-terminal domain-containing protein [Amycolatopsis sp., V23-08]